MSFLASSLLLANLVQPAPPLVRWIMDESRIQDGTLLAASGPNPEVSGFPKPVSSPWGPAMEMDGEKDTVTLPWFFRSRWPQDPKEGFSATAAFRVTVRKKAQRLAGCIFEDGGRLVGWQITLEDGCPQLEVGSQKGRTVIKSSQDVSGKWTWVTAGYTGSQAWLMVDGVEAGRKPAPFGPLPYSGRAPLAVSGFWHGSGTAEFKGAVRELRIDSPALLPAEAAQVQTHPSPVPPPSVPARPAGPLAWEIEPFLQSPFPGRTTLAFQASEAVSGAVFHGPRPDRLDRSVRVAPSIRSLVRLEGLPAGRPWFYRVEVKDGQGRRLSTPVQSFRTLPGEGQTVRFAVVGDTQSSPERSGRIASAMLQHRPDFCVVVGDLVGEGWLMSNWRDEFFASMKPLLAHAPLVPVLGNHERNARLYYLLMDSPEPKWRGGFRAGPCDFFILDTEHPTGPGSEQFEWLARSLAKAKGPWKVGLHHYPAYSSGYDDLDSPTDCGGDSQARSLVPLYDRWGLTAAFSGHIHHYERTFPMRHGKVDRQGVVYFTVGGGGGGLDVENPYARFDFSRIQKAVHHYALVTAGQADFQVQVFDWDNRLIDEWRTERPRP